MAHGGDDTLDDFLRMGRYTYLFIIYVEICILIQTGNQIFMSFAGAQPKLIGCQNQQNVSFPNTDNICDGFKNGTCKPTYTSPFYSVNEQWDIVCHKKHLEKDSTSAQMLGTLAGAIIFGQLSDSFGRKITNCICLIFTSITGIACIFSNSFLTFTIIRIATSFFNGGLTVVSLTYMCETFPKKHRMWLNFILSWSPNIILVSMLAFALRNWKSFSVVLNFLAFIPIIFTPFLYESPYFLLRQGETTKIRQIFIATAKRDKANIDQDHLDNVLSIIDQKSTTTKNKKYTAVYLFYTWKLVLYTVTLGVTFFCINLINYAVIFNMDELAGSLYENLFIIGGIRCVLNIAISFADFNLDWLGRKTNHYICVIYSLIALGFVFIAKILDVPSWNTAISIIFVSAGSVVCQLYMIGGVTTNEIYPGPIRSTAYAVNLFFANIGSVLAPQIFNLKKIWPSLPYGIMFVILILESILTIFFIPESKGKALVENMPTREERILSKLRLFQCNKV